MLLSRSLLSIIAEGMRFSGMSIHFLTSAAEHKAEVAWNRKLALNFCKKNYSLLKEMLIRHVTLLDQVLSSFIWSKSAEQIILYCIGAVSSSARRLSRTKSKKKHFVHQKVEVFWASDPILTVFMWGINHTINDLFQVPMPVMLLPDDFKANIKMKVNNHLFNKYGLSNALCNKHFLKKITKYKEFLINRQIVMENLPGHFKFKEYCPLVFRNLRERFGVEHQDYLQISSEEVEDMHNILSEYHQHIVTCHGSTLLPQFLGLYRVTVDNEDTYLLVMRNMFSHRLTIHRKYDLKGSLVSREASDKEKVRTL
ncbi:Phosphatidylinositol 5-phosphate 4-kinase type-2 gamma [Labeo rohita]|uniref:Phosphatidylinositol 5-phosphate 4-kinase type-2 gamma n=1 Tax=Labeo rohita TaxID=84645 RepID=A0ABQ8L247_LABRO|nr:Phosphatidylinositol 5-phosphate 4-kinase type-2 gamma [Labeo rohita]